MTTKTESMPRAPGPSPGGRGRGSRALILVVTAVMLLLVGTAVGFAVLLPSLVEDRIKAEARSRGVELVWTTMHFWFTSASFEGARFRLVGIPQIEATAQTIDVSLSSFRPTRVEATGVAVTATGSAADLALALSTWTAAHPGAFQVPVSAHDVGVEYRAEAGAAPWLQLSGGAMSEGAQGTTFTASQATLAGVAVGAVSAAWTAEAAAVSMGFGATEPAKAPLRLEVRHADEPPTATIALSPTRLGNLAGPLTVPLLPPDVVVSGQVDLRFERGLEAGPISGRLDSRLVGWIPPHPAELDGFLFGETTTFTTDLAIDASRRLVDLSRSRVKAGAFQLGGSGRIQRDDTHASIAMVMSGSLPCAAIAASAAAAHLGSFLSNLVGSAARKMVDGSVGVTVKLAADSRNLAAATVQPTIGVGCGLTPLRGLDTRALKGLPGKLQDLAKQLPALPELPDLPVFRLAPEPGAAP